MKFRITLKDPDGFYESIEEAAADSIKTVAMLSDKERESLTETRIEALKDACGRWFEYSEYLTVEVDVEARTCRVVEVGE